MDENTTASGLITICTATVFTHGRMVAATKASTLRIVSMVKVSTFGPMAVSMMVSGRMVDSMVKVPTGLKPIRSLAVASGSKESAIDGLMQLRQLNERET